MKLVLAVLSLCACTISAADDEMWLSLLSANIMEALAEEMPREGKDIPTLANDLGLTTLLELVKKANLAGALAGSGPFTLFGPTNTAFQALPKKCIETMEKNTTILAYILKYHVAKGKVLSTDLENDQIVPSLAGKTIRINIYKNGTVITASGGPVNLADQEASNGVIHEVAKLMIPPAGTVTAVVSKCPAFSYMLKAVKMAGLANLLDGAGPFTVFVPSDAAFKRIPPKCWEKLLNNKDLLTAVLKYHVVPSTLYSAGLSCGDKIKTANGEDVQIAKMSNYVYVNWAKVTFADASMTNGVMHVIDKVLIPNMGLMECEADNRFDKEEDNVEVYKNFFNF